MALEAFINGQKPKHSQPDEQDATLRFKLDLKEPTDETTNEFSYVLLVQSTREKTKDPLDPFGDDDEERLAAIAKNFEEKYGSKKRKRVIREQDCVHIGMGYDTSDSFVDDSEQYEDYVPPNVDTRYGGFYINTGELEFKQTEDSSSDYDFPLKRKVKPKIKKQPIHGTPTAILASKKLKLAKQRTQKKKLPALPSRVRSVMPKALVTSFSNQSLASQGSSSTEFTQTVQKDIKVKTEDAADVGANVVLFSSPSKCATDAALNSSSESKELRPVPTLPTGLPSDLLLILQQLDECVSKDQNKAGKLSNKAKGSYDHLLMEIESLCKSVSFRLRNAVYDYVAYRFRITRPSLLSRVKRIIKKKEAGTLEVPLQRLKQAIDEAMPAQIAQYEHEFQAYASSTASQVPSEKEGDGSKPSESVDDMLPASQENHNKVKKPRKKFQWTPEMRELLCEVVRLKVEAEQAARGKVQNGSELIERFLETDVKPLWPKGWMQRRILYKVSENVHKSFTGGSQGKRVQVVRKEPSKPVQMTAKKQLMLQEVGVPQQKPTTLETSQTSAAALRLVVPALLKASQVSTPVTTTTVSNRALQIQSIPFSTESPTKIVTTASSPTLVKTIFSSAPSPKLATMSTKPANPVSILKKPIHSTTCPVSILKKTGQTAGTAQQKTLASTITASLQPKLITTSKKTKPLGRPPNTGLSPVAPPTSSTPSTGSSMAPAGLLTSSGSHLVSSTISSAASQLLGNGKSLSLSLQPKTIRKNTSQPVVQSEPMCKQPIIRLPATSSPVTSKPGTSLQEPNPQHLPSVMLPETQSLLLSHIHSMLAHNSASNASTTSKTSTSSTYVSSAIAALLGQSASTSSQAQLGKTPVAIPGIASSQAQLMQTHVSVPGSSVSTHSPAQIGLAHVVIAKSMPSQAQQGHTHVSIPSSGSSVSGPAQVRLPQVAIPSSSSQASLAQTYISVPGTTTAQGSIGQTYIAIPSSSSSQLIQHPVLIKQPEITTHATQVLTEHSYVLKETTAPSISKSRDNADFLATTRKK